METTLSQIPSVSRRIIFWGAAYDVLVTAGFATPWTAAFVLRALSQLHTQFGLAGIAPSVVDPFTMLFVNLLGTIVLTWSVLRLFRPTLLNGAFDSAARLAFALWMLFAMQAGATTITWALLLGELIWFLLQGSAIVYALKKLK
ncbi:MAG: hypothetical protein Q7T89_07730 [Anaerolineales bacterium]|nr:hypothetical protein [Anaerolineales bacterium]